MLDSLDTMSYPTLSDFGKKYSLNIKYDDNSILSNDLHTLYIDIETDEKDNFVGLCVSSGTNDMYYFTSLSNGLKTWLTEKNFIGHNLKFDCTLLRKWGIPIKSERLYMDTMLMSYVYDPTKESHGLKDLAKELDIIYPTYKEIVGKGNKKVTLDKQSLETVSNYCALDVYSTIKLHHNFEKIMDVKQKYYLDKLDLPIMRLLFDMEMEGIKIDEVYLNELKSSLKEQVEFYEAQLIDSGLLNSRSPKQVKEWLNLKGIKVNSTGRKELQSFKDNPHVNILFNYREKFKLLSTYVNPLINLSPRVHTTFNQVVYDTSGDKWSGIRTGRLSSSNPNLHNIPVRTEAGKLLRKVFIAKPEHQLICADYSQIEYRLLAHFSDQMDLIEAFKQGKDIHEETGKLLGCDRKLGKTLNFASIYGAGVEKISKTAEISEKDAQAFLDTYWRKLPKVKSWIERIKQEAKRNGGIKTILGHYIPLPGLKSSNIYERFHWERAAVNYVIQGSAAEIIKLAMLRCREKGYIPVLQIHDELLFEVLKMKKDGTEYPFEIDIRSIMESVLELKVPLTVDIGSGNNWSEAKGD